MPMSFFFMQSTRVSRVSVALDVLPSFFFTKRGCYKREMDILKMSKMKKLGVIYFVFYAVFSNLLRSMEKYRKYKNQQNII